MKALEEKARLAEVKAHRAAEISVCGSPALQGMMKELAVEFSKAKTAVEIKYHAAGQDAAIGEFVGAPAPAAAKPSPPAPLPAGEGSKTPAASPEGEGSKTPSPPAPLPPGEGSKTPAALAAEETLKTDPDDGPANLLLGRWYCTSEKDWPRGLKCLVKAADPQLHELAQRDVASLPTDAEQQAKLGDAWWDLAQSRAGQDRTLCLARAGFWYQKAAARMPAGLLRIRTEKSPCGHPCGAFGVVKSGSAVRVYPKSRRVWSSATKTHHKMLLHPAQQGVAAQALAALVPRRERPNREKILRRAP